MAQNKFCPVCCAYMLFYTDIAMAKWKRCPSCGWCEDENGENLITKKLDQENLTPEERRTFIKHWRKLKDVIP